MKKTIVKVLTACIVAMLLVVSVSANTPTSVSDIVNPAMFTVLITEFLALLAMALPVTFGLMAIRKALGFVKGLFRKA
jgi:hypothetical protein